MQSWIKNILIAVMFIIFSVGGYLLYPKLNKNVIIPQREDAETALNSENSPEETKTNAVEPTALTPKKEDNIPPPEPPLPVGTDRFTISLTNTNEEIASNLLKAEFIANKESFITILNKEKVAITPGAYKLSKVMTPSQINKVLHNKPYMKWVVIKPGLRKEEIATILSGTLGWTSKQKNNWIKVDTNTSPEYTEGVYYPDTYLIPVDEEPSLVAKRLISKFNENFSTYLPQFTAKNIKWARALTLASIVQREASGTSDMPLVAGILWNRLNQNMALSVDATLQYIRGDIGKGWWAPITVADKQTDSPFNTYKYKGLPPHPISNPGISAIEAVLNPKVTDCLYYLHDKNRVTHCAKTYEEHQQNIETYLIGDNTIPS
ncbi:MAG: Aminodeoxychorismate lyase [Candidatus Nomurabacteria bacterium GW2011_GWE1_35_16]|uniref:Endolytic murein transglycosylase n=1 Tax=Candidatus Nomurabacteria bacterium GW2011_GWE1_35_16 TaxID=1618761 RepID=A0A0G0BC71_9BACT|nr:MAG: Aminodeoxychorismate lyase [Candidatus Nomurabacteria bacterium GW2011_GWF1_34_20]KKP63772.1 MAG: Aminodeoxychorismate lyase [Candidatus Nomurabacteria bacterium GW2011_GWE2_34_25]KKP66984.1 MAG: Aminodeoxychorismate lyase [Candidatus Nomurabacteria bacterium GW2011_GWE1_35_16]